MAASVMKMTAFQQPTPPIKIDTQPQQAPSPPRSQPASPIISRKPLPETPSHSHTMSVSTACPSCGHTFSPKGADEAQRMIADLQAQVKLLNSKAAAAVDRLADYEDELRVLRVERQQERGDLSNPATANGGFISSQQQQQHPPQTRNLTQPQSRLSTLRSYLGGRRNPSDSTIDTSAALATPNNLFLQQQQQQQYHPSYAASQPNLHAAGDPTAPSSEPTPTLHSLQSTLATEQALRLKAETNLTQTQMELEELTASLFGQANEMVAEERRARSKLEERVRILERREKEKGERLRRLEGRVERVERVRGLVG